MPGVYFALFLLSVGILPFISVPGLGTRDPKFYFSFFLCLAITIYGLYNGLIRAYKNKWLLFFVLSLPINYFFSPKVGVMIADVPAPSWVWQSSFFLFIFFMAHIVISHMKYTESQTSHVLRTMVWSTTISACYGMLQWLGFDQFFVSTNKWACGGMGNPALLAALVVMAIPLAIGLKMYWHILICGLACIFLNSQVAFGALFLSLAFIVSLKSLMWRYITIGLITGLTVFVAVGYFHSPEIKRFVGDHGRFSVWKQVVMDVRGPENVPDSTSNPKHAITGFGLGSFQYYFHSLHPVAGIGETFLEAHNEYLELFYNTGLLGLILFLCSLWYFITSCFPLTGVRVYLFASFISLAICAGGLFVWHNGALIFYTLVITGLLNQTKEGNNAVQG